MEYRTPNNEVKHFGVRCSLFDIRYYNFEFHYSKSHLSVPKGGPNGGPKAEIDKLQNKLLILSVLTTIYS